MSYETALQALADPTKPLIGARLTGLSLLTPDETATFLKLWQEIGPARRQHLVHELIELAEDNVELNFDAVFFIGLSDDDASVRRSAISGLWEHEGRDLIEPLVRLLRSDPDAGVRADAAMALGHFVLQAELNHVRAADTERIESVLRDTIEDTAEVVEVRGRALEAIGARSLSWVHDLIQQLFESPERRLRLSAIHAMGRSCDAGWLPTLVEELENEDAEARFEAAIACGFIADQAALDHLLPLIYDDDREVQLAAISALGEIGGAEAKEALAELLESDDEGAQEAALAALAELDFSEDPLGFTVSE